MTTPDTQPESSGAVVVFGSRGSELALVQSRAVASNLANKTGVATRIEVLSTRGDRELSMPLPEIGGKGLFTSELETALRDRSIDVAVHSLKDLPVEDPDGVIVGAIPPRASVHDVLLCRRDRIVADGGPLPLCAGARVGTSSLRRAGALRLPRPDLEFVDIRGNVPTRVAKLASGDYDAVVLAAAGLERLAIDLGPDLVSIRLPLDWSPPAPGQGALGVQCRVDDRRVRDLLGCLHDPHTAACVLAERRVLGLLGGGCSMPLGAVVQAQADDGYRLHCGLFARGTQQGGVFRTRCGSDLDLLAEQVAADLSPFVEQVALSVVLARPDAERGVLGDAIAIACPKLRVVASSRTEPIAVDSESWPAIGSDTALAFTSARAVHQFFRVLHEQEVVPQSVVRTAFAIGPATAAALGEFGVTADLPTGGAATGGAQLARHLLASDLDSAATIVFPCAIDRHNAFEDLLRGAGREVRPLPLYRSVALERSDYGPLSRSVVVVTSPSGVSAFAAAERVTTTRCVAIGQTTADACAAAGLEVDVVAAEPDAVSVVAAIRVAANTVLATEAS